MLIGELLFKLAGISGKAEIDEEEIVIEATTTDNSRRALTEMLGQDRRDRVLSSLYLVRQDGVSTVRQSSLHVWKALVQNTPRTGWSADGHSTDIRHIFLPSQSSRDLTLDHGADYYAPGEPWIRTTRGPSVFSRLLCSAADRYWPSDGCADHGRVMS